MALSLGSFTFSGRYGAIVEQPPEVAMQRIQFPGAYGEAHLLFPPGGTSLQCEYILDGLASRAALKYQVSLLHSWAGILTGTLNQDGVTWTGVTFLGWTPTGLPSNDPHHDYTQFGVLQFRRQVIQ
ncbi:hypothetical protein KOR42_39340 [Thalassoglobus neptunius]|uniref:Uncharacterized protein n=1 Tax=Thalassoglobus neptunius TaxID=1938619 RepID=A0A5C5WDN1_9PLAN|nr:hypothetical protein [Thalassoglobus neptunius]TWT49018.1 hypothetical protein KOR42_39340 [Thalassoglobus neptunius]